MTQEIAQSSGSEQSEVSDLIGLFSARQYAAAEAAARRMIQSRPEHGFGWKVLGTVLIIQQRLAEALPILQRAQTLLPSDAEAKNNFGVALRACGRMPEAEPVFRRASELNPDYHEAQHNLAFALQALGRLGEAETCYRRALALKPELHKAHCELGNVLHGLGRPADAQASYRRALALAPDDAEAHSNLGCVLNELGRFPDAEASSRQALAREPDLAEAHNNLGNALLALGRPAEAEASFRRVLELRPEHSGAHSNLGNALRRLDRREEAEASYRRALELRPGYGEAYSNLGNVLHELGRLSEAEASCREALRLVPGLPEAHNNLGLTLGLLGRQADAIASFGRASELKPDFYDAHRNLASLLMDLGRLIEAETAYRRGLQLRPDLAGPWQSLAALKAYQSDYTEVKALSDAALERLSWDKRERYVVWESRLYVLSYHPDLSAAEIFAEFVRWGDLQDRSGAILRHDNERSPQRRLRVGYVSPDFRHHTSEFYFEPLFANHNRDNVELFAYSNVRRPDDATERFRQIFEHWRDIGPLSDDAAARLVRDDRIDILVDGCNHMRDERLGVFARKPAPVQVTWLGAAWTSGLPAMDYVLFDPYLAPEGTLAREAIVRLPHSFVPFRPRAEFDPSGPAPCMRNGYVTFGYFGRTERLNHRIFRAWGRILAALPKARLILDLRAFGDPPTRVYYQGFLAQHGVDLMRVTMRYSPDVSKALRDIDIMFDSFPHCGGTMSYDAVCMGVPLLTLAGRPPLGRIGAGIMNNLGLAEWVAADEQAYVAKAVAFAENMSGLAELRRGMRGRLAASPWRDEAGYARDLERAYREMWRRWCAGEAAARFDVAPEPRC